MEDMRIAVFVGGPHDGKAMLVHENTPWIHLPAREEDIMLGLQRDAPLDKIVYNIANYQKENVQWSYRLRSQTKVVLYLFDGMIR